jgi:hypothetical protein
MRAVVVAPTAAEARADVEELNALARARLRGDRLLGRARIELAGGEFAVGDQVVVKRNDLRFGIMNGQRAEVVAVQPTAGLLSIDVGGRRIDLDRRFLSTRIQDGGPTLLRGYAMTGHVAQGATVDRSFVLASEGMGREWGYVALSRGRQGNRLYLAAQPDDARAEFAPVSPESRDPIERLAATLRDSDAQVLAIDSGRADVHERRIEAERAAVAATSERRALEERGRLWLPGRRRALETARKHELAAHELFGKTRHAEAEAMHGRRRFAPDRDRELDNRWQRIDDRATERVLRVTTGSGGSSERDAEDAGETGSARAALHAHAQGGHGVARDQPQPLRAARAARAQGRAVRAARADPGHLTRTPGPAPRSNARPAGSRRSRGGRAALDAAGAVPGGYASMSWSGQLPVLART